MTVDQQGPGLTTGLISAGMLERFSGKTTSAEVYERRRRSLELSFAGGQLRSVQHDEAYECSARAIVDGRVGFSSVTDPTAGERLAQSVLASAPFGTPAAFELPGPVATPPPPVAVHDSATAAAELIELRQLGERALEGLHTAYPDTSHEVRITCALETWRLANTSGLDHTVDETRASMALSSTHSETDDLFQCGAMRASRRLDDLPGVLERLLQKLNWGRQLVAPPSGRRPVVFLPEGVGLLLMPLRAAAAGGLTVSGSSPLSGREGEGIVDERLSVTLDPTLPYGVASLTLDHEGVLARPLPIFERGVFRGFYHDLTTAARSGARPTGHGRRGRMTLPQPAPGNTVIAAGDRPFAELIADIEDGLLVESVIGGGQGNVLSGAFSNTVGVAYRIQNGEITGRTKDVSLAGNAYDLLRDNLHSLSTEVEAIGGQIHTPAIRIEDVNLVS